MTECTIEIGHVLSAKKYLLVERELNIARTAAHEWMVSDMRIDEAIKFAEHAQTMTDIPEVKEFYAMAEKALRTQNQVNWIGVKDRLPERGKRVLCYIKASDESQQDIVSENVYRGRLVGSNPTRHVWSWDGDYVSHWMPLPEPPERE